MSFKKKLKKLRGNEKLVIGLLVFIGLVVITTYTTTNQIPFQLAQSVGSAPTIEPSVPSAPTATPDPIPEVYPSPTPYSSGTLGVCIYLPRLGSYYSQEMLEQNCTDEMLRRNSGAGLAEVCQDDCRALAFCPPGTPFNQAGGWVEDMIFCTKKDNPKLSSYFQSVINGRNNLIDILNNGEEISHENQLKDRALLTAVDMEYSCPIFKAGEDPKGELKKTPLINTSIGKLTWETWSRYNKMISKISQVESVSDPMQFSCSPFPLGCSISSTYRGNKRATTVDLSKDLPESAHHYGLAIDIKCGESVENYPNNCGPKTQKVFELVQGHGFNVIRECTTRERSKGCSDTSGTSQVIHLDLFDRTIGKPYKYGPNATKKVLTNCEW